MSLSDAELDRYARHIVLPQVGGVGQNRLKAASVVVIGAGGIGSAVIPALAGAGIGRLTIVDDDVVELGNLHRQPLFRERDAGYSKADLRPAPPEEAQAEALVERDDHLVPVSAARTHLDANLLLDLRRRVELDDRFLSLDGLEIDAAGRDLQVESDGAGCLESLAPHRFFSTLGGLDGRLSTRTSVCPHGSG